MWKARLPAPAVLLFGLLAASAAAGQPATKLPADLALLPSGTVALASFRPAEVARHPAARIGGLGPGWRSLEALERAALLGLPRDQVERATLALVAAGQPVTVVRTRKPYDRARLLKALGPAVQEQKVGGKTLHVGQEG